MMKSSFKDKILGLFGSFGIVVWYIIIGILYVLPFVILHLPWWGIAIAMIAFSIPPIGEFARMGVYIWAFTEALKQQQDIFVIAFYIFFGLYSLYFITTLLSSFGRKS